MLVCRVHLASSVAGSGDSATENTTINSTENSIGMHARTTA